MNKIRSKAAAVTPCVINVDPIEEGDVEGGDRNRRKKKRIPHVELGALVGSIQSQLSKAVRFSVDFGIFAGTESLQSWGVPRSDSKEVLDLYANAAEGALTTLACDLNDTAAIYQVPFDAHAKFGRTDVQLIGATANESGVKLNDESGMIEVRRNNCEDLHRRNRPISTKLGKLRKLGFSVTLSYGERRFPLEAASMEALQLHIVAGKDHPLVGTVRGCMPDDSVCLIHVGGRRRIMEIERRHHEVMKEALYKGQQVRFMLRDYRYLNPLVPPPDRCTLLEAEFVQGELLDAPKE